MVPVALQGASSSTASSGAGAPPPGHVRLGDVHRQAEPGQVFVQAADPQRVALDGEHVGAGRGELRGLAARGRAEVGDAFAGPGGEQPGRQRGGRVLHPEPAFREALQILNPGAGGKADGPGRQHLARQRRLGAGRQREVERRFPRMRFGDRPRVPPPARPEPGGRVEPRTVEPVQRRLALVGDPAQHRVHQPGERRQLARPGQAHRGRHRGVRRRVEQQQPRRAEPQHVPHRLWRRAGQERLEHGIERAEPAQHRGGEPVRRGPVARLGPAGPLQTLIERAAAVQHRAEQVEGNLAGGVGRVARGGRHGPVHGAERGRMLGLGMSRLLATRRPYLLLTLFCLLLWTPGLFTLPPGDRDESRFAQATKQMIETGDFVRILNGTEARNRKPIGIYWLQSPFVAAADAAGLARANPIWPYRLPSALGALVAVLGTFALGSRLLGRAAALLGAAFLAGGVILSTEAHIAKTDAALLGSIVLAMGVLARAYPRRCRRPRTGGAVLAGAGGQHPAQGADRADGGGADGAHARYRGPAGRLAAGAAAGLGRAAAARGGAAVVRRDRAGDAWTLLRRGGGRRSRPQAQLRRRRALGAAGTAPAAVARADAAGMRRAPGGAARAPGASGPRPRPGSCWPGSCRPGWCSRRCRPSCRTTRCRSIRRCACWRRPGCCGASGGRWAVSRRCSRSPSRSRWRPR